ncbi:MAG TPA: MFS transporter [Opitutaceae bacterium]|jgi:MFS family permease
MSADSNAGRRAFRFVLAFGVVNLFADMTYEGARSATGAFLGALGASATAVGIAAGLGELMGYSFRLVTGYFADRTRRYWAFIIGGYAVNLLAVPALALAGSWPAAAALMVIERTGRAVRKPSVEALLSEAGDSIGQGWVFGLNEALDQTGATVGPLIVALVLYLKGGYREGFAVLLVPALLCLATIAAARLSPAGRSFAGLQKPRGLSARGQAAPYWWFLAAGCAIAAGFSDFALIAYRLQTGSVIRESMIPALYSAAMATAAVAALLLGRLLDRLGRPVLILAFVPSILSAPLVLLGPPGAVLAGMVLWGVGLGAQDSLLKAALAPLVDPGRRALGFGMFDAAFGVSWFVGSVVTGFLYDRSAFSAAAFSAALQLAALPLLVVATRPRAAA